MKKLALIGMLLCLASSNIQALTMEDILEDAAGRIRRSGEIDVGSNILSVEMVNYHSKQQDKTAKRIESLLYFALEDMGFRTVLLSEALAGSSSNTIYIKGSYEGRGETVLVRLQAVKGLLSGEVLTQFSVEYEEKKQRSNTLVAVLDIESKVLPDSMKKAFSDLFRSSLGEVGGFDLASSADVDKMNPDAIQEATGCTRDECATIIGEQLGVDRVISTSLFKLTGDKFMLTSKVMDILDGSILKTSIVKYHGQIEDIDEPLEQLASKLAGRSFTGGATESIKSGQLLIKSTPPGASITLNGRKLRETTPVLLKKIPAGEHKLLLLKDNSGKDHSFELDPGEIKKLDLKLEKAYSIITFESDPFDASIYVNDRYLGKTPYKGRVAAGKHQIRFEMAEHSPHTITLNVLPFIPDSISTRLKPETRLTLEIEPADASLLVDGKSVGSPQPSSPELLWQSRIEEMKLPQGIHRFTLSHPHGVSTLEKSLNLESKKQRERLKLTIDPEYLAAKKAEIAYTSDLSSWETKLTISLIATVITGLYSASEYQNAQDQLNEMEANETLMSNAGTLSEASSYYAKANKNREAIDNHNQGMQNGMILSTLLAGYGLWVWMDEPEKPDDLSWRSTITPQGAQLVYSMRW